MPFRNFGQPTVTVVTDADGGVTTYHYDGLHRLVAVQYPEATVTYACDALGRRTAMTDTTGVTTYSYDDLGRVLTVSAPYTGTVAYAYDLTGNRTALTVTTTGGVLRATYYAYDADNRLLRVTDWATGTTGYGYDAAGRLITTTLPNGIVTTHSYDAAGQLTDLSHARGSTLLAHYRYALDAVGNRTQVTETVRGVTRVITYTYDPLYRLTAADYTTGERYGYQYDAVGNRLVLTDTTGTTTYTYDLANRLASIQLPDASIQTYTWDNRGNLIYDGVYTYTYNTANRMVQAQSVTVTLVYTYNADGLRIAQSQSVASVQSVDTFTWDWVTGVPELLSDGDNLYLVGYDTLGWQRGDDWTFVLPDALGSVRQETDAAGAVTLAREWSPYGEEVGGAQTGLGFTGEWFNANVGLTYLRARWYQPGTGTFISGDVWEGNPQLPTSLHQWLYAFDNPINLFDSSGLSPLDDCDEHPKRLVFFLDGVGTTVGGNYEGGDRGDIESFWEKVDNQVDNFIYNYKVYPYAPLWYFSDNDNEQEAHNLRLLAIMQANSRISPITLRVADDIERFTREENFIDVFDELTIAAYSGSANVAVRASGQMRYRVDHLIVFGGIFWAAPTDLDNVGELWDIVGDQDTTRNNEVVLLAMAYNRGWRMMGMLTPMHNPFLDIYNYPKVKYVSARGVEHGTYFESAAVRSLVIDLLTQ